MSDAHHPHPPGYQEPMSNSPLWLEYSGLPEWVNSAVNRSAWPVLKKIIELDCARNARPATIEVTPAEIAGWCGLEPSAVANTLKGLRRKKCLALFLPDHPEESALIEIRIPLPTPRPAHEVRGEFPFNALDPSVRLRYAGGDAASETAAPSHGDKRDLQRIIDLYFNTVGLKMNTFVLDELRLVAQRFDLDLVEKTFERARKNDIRSLGWVVKELYRVSRRHERTKN